MALIVPKPFLWTAFPSMVGNYSRIIELAKRLGFGGIAPRAGQGHPNGQFTASLFMKDITAIVDAGLECLPWVYSYPQAVDSEIACAWRCQDAGATHFIIDAEAPWDANPNSKSCALRYGDDIKRHLTIPVYDAPWPWINYHPGYPEKEFRWVDGRMIQSYWTEINGKGARACLDESYKQWDGKDRDRLLPIGITYGRKEMAKWGAKQLPPGEISLEDVRVAYPEIKGGWYSVEAAGEGVLDALSGLIAADTTTECMPSAEGGTGLPMGALDRLEQELAEGECTTFYCRNRNAFSEET